MSFSFCHGIVYHLVRELFFLKNSSLICNSTVIQQYILIFIQFNVWIVLASSLSLFSNILPFFQQIDVLIPGFWRVCFNCTFSDRLESMCRSFKSCTPGCSFVQWVMSGGSLTYTIVSRFKANLKTDSVLILKGNRIVRFFNFEANGPNPTF